MRSLIAVRRLLVPSTGYAGGRVTAVATIGLFGLGAALACAWVLSVASAAALAALVIALTALAALAIAARPTAVRSFAAVAVALVHLFWVYVVVSLGSLLAWTIPWHIKAVAAVLAIVAVAGALAPAARFRLPTAVPLGIWIIACLIGWQREDGVIRCDDYSTLLASRGSLLVATTPELERCRPGESLRTQHYPRRIWEAPEGNRLVITTQLGIGRLSPPGRPVADRFPGTVCDVPIGGEPSCFGRGKAQGIVESAQRERLFVAGWQQGFDDGKNGVLYFLSTSPPLRRLEELHFDENVAELFYDSASDTIGLLSDEARWVQRVRVSDRARLEPLPAPVVPGETRYDSARGEGVFCFGAGPLKTLEGEPFLSIAFRGDPFSMRPLGGAGTNPLAWISMVWGCDWDVETRRVYVANASLGLMSVVDYDSGRILRRFPIDFGVRFVTLDSDRNLLYLANFLRGDVVAVALDTGAELRRWFGGRFMRHLILSRDRKSLLATSNLGVVEIPLGELAGHAAAAATFGRRQIR